MKPTTRNLIVNADDFGLSPGVNRGIIRAHEHGILTSTSLMVRWPAATEAASLARKHPGLSVGLHVDLAEWIFREGEWSPKYQIVPADDAGAVAAEVARQLESFRRLVGKNPTHVDSHQHVHRNEPVRSVLLRLARELGVPLRSFDALVNYCGSFYGQTGEGDPYPEGISLDGLLNIFAGLPGGVTEMACHPGEAEGLDSVYCAERSLELKVLCSPRVQAAVKAHGIRLCSFAELPGTPEPLTTA